MFELFTDLSSNPYFGAGFGLFSVGAVAAIGRKVSQNALILLRRRYVTTLGKLMQHERFIQFNISNYVAKWKLLLCFKFSSETYSKAWFPLKNH